jgi:hypothetical protein
MLWHNEIITATVTAGTAASNTASIKGVIEQIIVTPRNSAGAIIDTSDWSLDLIDRNDDVVRRYQLETGRLEDIDRVPVGGDRSEKLTLTFTSISGTVATMRIVLKIRETVQ